MEGGLIVEKGEADAYGHRKLGGVGEYDCSRDQAYNRTGYHVSTIRIFDAIWRTGFT